MQLRVFAAHKRRSDAHPFSLLFNGEKRPKVRDARLKEERIQENTGGPSSSLFSNFNGGKRKMGKAGSSVVTHKEPTKRGPPFLIVEKNKEGVKGLSMGGKFCECVCLK